jgi:hypothetical protein
MTEGRRLESSEHHVLLAEMAEAGNDEDQAEEKSERQIRCGADSIVFGHVQPSSITPSHYQREPARGRVSNARIE